MIQYAPEKAYCIDVSRSYVQVFEYYILTWIFLENQLSWEKCLGGGWGDIRDVQFVIVLLISSLMRGRLSEGTPCNITLFDIMNVGTWFPIHAHTHRAVVVVIDSVNFPSESRSVAELFFDLLSDRVIHKKKVSILVVCNKQDLALARSSEEIRKLLEAEL